MEVAEAKGSANVSIEIGKLESRLDSFLTEDNSRKELYAKVAESMLGQLKLSVIQIFSVNWQ